MRHLFSPLGRCVTSDPPLISHLLTRGYTVKHSYILISIPQHQFSHIVPIFTRGVEDLASATVSVTS